MTAGPADPIVGQVYRSTFGGPRVVVIHFDEGFVWLAGADYSKRRLKEMLGTKRGQMTSRREFAEEMRREVGDGIPFDPDAPRYRL